MPDLPYATAINISLATFLFEGQLTLGARIGRTGSMLALAAHGRIWSDRTTSHR